MRIGKLILDYLISLTHRNSKHHINSNFNKTIARNKENNKYEKMKKKTDRLISVIGN
jgi:hypothetical protein